MFSTIVSNLDMRVNINQKIDTLFTRKRERRTIFFLVTVGIFTVTYGVLFLIDFLPEEPKNNDRSVSQEVVTKEEPLSDVVADTVVEQIIVDPKPVKVIFETLDREVNILNPEITTVATLDEALLSGVVRHPDSADFENEGTMFLFGHSSYLPNVFNKNFQAFNDVQNLEWGDKIRVQSSDTEYVYRVDRVYQVKASEAEVAIERGEAKLTLATCNSFGSKDDRYIVEATLVNKYPLESVR